MTAREITEVGRALFSYAYWDKVNWRQANPMYNRPGKYDLGSTPLVEALIGMQAIIPWFKKSNKLDIVNLVTLTDGEPNTAMTSVYNGEDVSYTRITGYGMEPHFQDPITRKTYNLYKDFQKKQ